MPLKFDSAFKHLLECDPAGCVRLALGPVEGIVRVIDADISVVSGAADKVVRLECANPVLIHFEAFATWDPTLPARAMLYSAIHHRRQQLPVHTVLVILRPEADHPTLTGSYTFRSPFKENQHRLDYDVLRIWTLDLEAVLGGAVSTLPLAPITDAAQGRLPEGLRRMDERLHAEAAPEVRKDLLADAYVLLGLRQTPENVAQLFRGVPGMRESSTYQAIIEEGRELGHREGRQEGRQEGRHEGHVEEARKALILAASPRLGEPDAAVRARIDREDSLGLVEDWLRRVTLVEYWRELIPQAG